ncbi:hypothetical protein GVN20_28885 [Runella sp. CRIBMP]|uniref:hypothetical protein n=1 Tax=Runella sp. CRIBMP TaxID=2683261 RepID=UPI001412677F|nr:hypothetical protein [Runella sp. CRIBMP]NBB23401.1 hypothetical protein [Runella sp. CRIBMP]
MPVLILIIAIACLIILAMIPEEQARLLPPPIQLIRMGVRLVLKTIVVLVGLSILGTLGYFGFEAASEYLEKKEAEKIELENSQLADSTVVDASYDVSSEAVAPASNEPIEAEIAKFKRAERRIMYGSWSLKDESEFPYDLGVYTFKKDGSFYKEDGSTGSWELEISGNYTNRSDCGYTLFIHEVKKSRQFSIPYFNEKTLSGKVNEYHKFELIKRLNVEPDPNAQTSYQPTQAADVN